MPFSSTMGRGSLLPVFGDLVWFARTSGMGTYLTDATSYGGAGLHRLVSVMVGRRAWLIGFMLLVTSCGNAASEPSAPIQESASTVGQTGPSSSIADRPGPVPDRCGEFLPVFATVMPSARGEFDADGSPGPGPGSLPVEENQFVAHWLGGFGVVVEVRWPATQYLNEPAETEPVVGGFPLVMAPWSTAPDNDRVVARVQLFQR